MYKIEKKPWGYYLTFSDSMSALEMHSWVEESRSVLNTAVQGFGVFVDMRRLRPLPPDARTIMQEGQRLYKRKGMSRSVVILESAMVTLQFQRIAKDSGIYAWERYIDSSSVPNWQEKGLAWVRDQIDPDA